MKPTRERKRAAQEAIEDYMAYESLGSPGLGGVEDQPAEWVESIMATTSAAKKVKGLIKEELKAEEDKKAKEQQKKAKASRGSGGRKRRGRR